MRRKQTQTLGEILKEVTQSQHLEEKLDEMKIVAIWPEVVGNIINEYTTHLSTYNRTLYVSLTSAVLRNELLMHKTQLIYKLNQKAGKQIITNIIFK